MPHPCHTENAAAMLSGMSFLRSNIERLSCGGVGEGGGRSGGSLLIFS